MHPPGPARKIYPYTTQPDEVTPGVPTYYASAAPLGGFGTGILVRSNEGRPTKVEGNPDHPSSLGGVGSFALASILDLYDPDRSRGVTHRGLPSSYEEAVAALRRQLFVDNKPKAGLRLRIVTEAVTSPTLADRMGRVLNDFPDARWVQHDLGDRANVREGARKAFGRPVNVTYDFTKADVVLALDSDFLTCGPGAARYQRDFADRRKIRADGKDAAAVAAGRQPGKAFTEGVKAENLNRLYAVESMPTPTGSVADHRLTLPASQVEAFARALAAELGVAGAPAGSIQDAAAKAWLKPLADDLRAHKGRCVVTAGDHQPASLHALAHAINSTLGAIGQTVFVSAPVEARPDGKVIDLKTLAAEIAASKNVDVLLVLGANPAYTAASDIPFAHWIKSVPFTLHLGTHQDETGVLCEWHVPEAHFLETWGDVRGHDGTVSIQQPLIAPLFGGRSALEFLSAAFSVLGGGEPREGLDIVRAYWKNRFGAEKRTGEFEVFWQESVRSGVVAGTAAAPEAKVALDGGWAAGAPSVAAAPSPTDLEINFRLDPTLHDGRYANNGWLQELPKPITKLTWDNAAIMGPGTADRLKIDKTFRWTAGEHGRVEMSVIDLTVGGKKVTAPVWVQPGHPENSITVHLGYGRPRAGRVNSTPDEPNAAGDPVRGFNAFTILTTDSAGRPVWTAAGATVAVTGKTYFLGCTQAHWVTTQRDPITGHEMDRKPVRFGTLDDYKKEPAFAKVPPQSGGEWHEIQENTPGPKHHEEGGSQGDAHDKHALTMYHPNDRLVPGAREEQRRRWAMAIDLNGCTGCSACVLACQAENNIPVVGKYEVTRAREMHWLRIDRYYVGNPADPNSLTTLFQPLACVHCEKAPCEVVCPVGATVHSADGLNDMVYNRCVGTRYCSNNCPYKVRRFNFLTFNDWDTNTLKLGRNPDVTVRSRGVMEKCTFCVQRIRGAEIVAEREGRPIRDGEILTACQSACPSGVIMFGDLNDSHSAVSKWKTEPRNYGLLAELNTMPRLTHLAIVRNPNPAMPKVG